MSLLYDLPQSSSQPPDSPPPLPQFTHSRSVTPVPVARQELDEFAAHCQAWYFHQDERAGQLMTETVESLPPSQRPPFMRLQANIRSAYHCTMTKRRTSEFKAHLSSTYPGGSLMPHARANPFGSLAKKERIDKFHKFLRTWCTTGMPGTSPFFRALWALMRLQVLPTELGGAGSKKIEWELDDAVFQESAGKEFMLEAIDVLKGVLGFEEHLPSRSRPQSDLQQDSNYIPSMSFPRRPRSPSDPFLDSPVVLQSLLPTSRLSTIESNPRPLQSEPHDDDVSDGEYIRIWTTADLDNPEFQRLGCLFPEFIARQTMPRFNTTQSGRDLEEGLDGEEGFEVRYGTGRLCLSAKERREGWRGSWWHRFTVWWRRLFC